MNRYLQWCLFALTGCVMLAIAGCVAASPENKKIEVVSENEVNAMGARAFADLKANSPPATDNVFSARVACISARLLASVKASHDHPSWEVITVGGRDPAVTAFAGGKIVVNEGMSSIASTPDELAAAIATSISRVTLGQASRYTSRQMATTSSGQAAVLLAQSLLNNMRSDIDDAIAADKEGRALLVAAGFNPAASVTLLEKMANGRYSPFTLGLKQRLVAAKSEMSELAGRRLARADSQFDSHCL